MGKEGKSITNDLDIHCVLPQDEKQSTRRYAVAKVKLQDVREEREKTKE
jgi:hypothetical protein